MKRGRLAVLVAGVVASCVMFVGVVTAQDLSGIDSCVSRLDPQLDIGYDRIAARCPELAKQLEHGAWVPWLPRGWKESRNDLSAGGLREFRDLVARENGAGLSGRAPDVRGLKVVLSGLAGTSTEGRWSRFKSWLRSVLERREQPTTDDGWLTRLVSRVGVPQSVRQIIAYSALGVVILLAAAIVANELRAAGLLPRRRLAVRGGYPAASATGATAVLWSDFESASLSDQPRLLLELIIRRLSDRGYLPPATALTVRELTRAARLPEPEDRTRLVDLALAAERVRFSARDPQSERLQSERLNESIARGRELLDRLEASTVAVGAVGAPK